MKKVAANTDTSQALDSVERAAALVGGAKQQMDRMLIWLREDAKDQDLHEVERGLLRQLLELGATLLRYHLTERGTGREGGTVLREGEPLPFHDERSRSYLSIFGLLDINAPTSTRSATLACSPSTSS